VNYDHLYRGPVLLRQALASSFNLVAVKVLDYVGLEDMTALARRLGITTLDDSERFGLALTLGGGEVRLLELTAAYAAFADGGHRVEPVAILRVEDSQGNVLREWRPEMMERVLDERVAYLITDILSDDTARISGFGEGSVLKLSRRAAAKTCSRAVLYKSSPSQRAWSGWRSAPCRANCLPPTVPTAKPSSSSPTLNLASTVPCTGRSELM